MYTIKLKPTGEYGAKDVAKQRQRRLDGSIGICEPNAEQAIQSAEENLPEDEIGVYYTIEAVEVEID